LADPSLFRGLDLMYEGNNFNKLGTCSIRMHIRFGLLLVINNAVCPISELVYESTH